MAVKEPAPFVLRAPLGVPRLMRGISDVRHVVQEERPHANLARNALEAVGEVPSLRRIGLLVARVASVMVSVGAQSAEVSVEQSDGKGAIGRVRDRGLKGKGTVEGEEAAS